MRSNPSANQTKANSLEKHVSVGWFIYFFVLWFLMLDVVFRLFQMWTQHVAFLLSVVHSSPLSLPTWPDPLPQLQRCCSLNDLRRRTQKASSNKRISLLLTLRPWLILSASSYADPSVSKIRSRRLNPNQTRGWMEISMKQQQRESGSLHNNQELEPPHCTNETDQQVNCPVGGRALQTDHEHLPEAWCS